MKHDVSKLISTLRAIDLTKTRFIEGSEFDHALAYITSTLLTVEYTLGRYVEKFRLQRDFLDQDDISVMDIGGTDLYSASEEDFKYYYQRIIHHEKASLIQGELTERVEFWNEEYMDDTYSVIPNLGLCLMLKKLDYLLLCTKLLHSSLDTSDSTLTYGIQMFFDETNRHFTRFLRIDDDETEDGFIPLPPDDEDEEDDEYDSFIALYHGEMPINHDYYIEAISLKRLVEDICYTFKKHLSFDDFDLCLKITELILNEYYEKEINTPYYKKKIVRFITVTSFVFDQALRRDYPYFKRTR